MPANQAGDIIRLGSLIIPILVLFIAGQALRFDPNRRVVRPSVVKAAIQKYEQPWGVIFAVLRWLVIALVALDLAEITLASLSQQRVLANLPAWAIFQNPNESAIFATLALFAIWIIRRLKHMSMRIFDQVFETHLDFADWRTVNLERDSRPSLHLGKWRYQMKWNFKTNPEPIDALHMRMIIDCPTFDIFEQHIKDKVYPPSFQGILNYYPYGRFVGTIHDLMLVDVLQRMYRSQALFNIWEGERNPQTGEVITNKDQMAKMIYAEIRTLIVCQTCGAESDAMAVCQTCNGSGAQVIPCLLCHGKGMDAKSLPCKQCGGLGLHHRPILVAFMNRLQYIWMARNVDYLVMTYPIWLSYRTYVGIFVASSAIFSGASLLSGTPVSPDLLVDGLLFGSAALLGSLGAAIVVIFGSAFNGSGMLLASYPLRYTKFGNHIWFQLMNLIGLLTFGTLLIDTTFVLSQVLFVSHINIVLLVIATSVLTLFVILFSFGGFYSIHTAMRDTKRSRLDELTEWLYQSKHGGQKIDTTQEEEFFKEIRELQEWPIDIPTTLGIVSGILLPVMLSLGSVLPGYLASIFHR